MFPLLVYSLLQRGMQCPNVGCVEAPQLSGCSLAPFLTASLNDNTTHRTTCCEKSVADVAFTEAPPQLCCTRLQALPSLCVTTSARAPT